MTEKWYRYKKDNAGGFLKGFSKIIFIELRNQFRLKPRARAAKNAVMFRLKGLGWKPKESYLNLGLGEPDLLGLVLEFATDRELEEFKKSSCENEIKDLFHQVLLKSRYPAWAVPKTEVTYHSQEAIERAGGWYNYFK